MSYRTKKEVLDSIRKHETNKNGKCKYVMYEAYFGIDPFTKKPVRKYSRSRADLEKKIEEHFSTFTRSGEVGVSLSRFQAMDAMMALDILARANSQATLVDTVRAFLSHEQEKINASKYSITLGEAYDRFYASLAGRSSGYKKDIRVRVGRLVQDFGADTLATSITAAKVKEILMERLYDANNPKTWKTYNNYLGNIKTFFTWCAAVEQNLIPDDPLSGMKKLELPYRQPEYMKTVEVEKLFRLLAYRVANQKGTRSDKFADADLADAILSFFCGMRQEEIERVCEGEDSVAINLTEGYIIVKKCKGWTRGIKPRTFQIPSQALAWMKSFDFMTAVMKKNRFRRHLKKECVEANIKLTENAGRHTFITMHTAAYHNESALSAIAGNTEDVRSRNYDGVEITTEGRAYFSILPLPSVSLAQPSLFDGVVSGGDGESGFVPVADSVDCA